MAETWGFPATQTRIVGPLADWEYPDGYWTPEFEAAIAAARESGADGAPCPICSELVHGADVDRIYFMQSDLNILGERFAGDLGCLITLRPCGHTLKR